MSNEEIQAKYQASLETQAEVTQIVTTLASYGYCNIGEGRIARRDVRDVSQHISREIRDQRRWPQYKHIRDSTLMTMPDIDREDMYRSYFAKFYEIGQFANLLPDSKKTETGCIRLEDNERINDKALRKRLKEILIEGLPKPVSTRDLYLDLAEF